MRRLGRLSGVARYELWAGVGRRSTVMAMRAVSSMATKALLTDLLGDPAVVGETSIDLESGGGVTIADQVRSGEPVDLVLLAKGALARLADEGHVVPDTVVPLFVSEVVLAVPSGGELPSLESEDDLRQILLSSERIGYSTGPSGDGLLRLLEQWGVRDHLADRLVQAPAGTPVAHLLAAGEISVGVQQRSEFTGVDGVTVVGALPPGCEIVTVFGGAVASVASDPEGARRILDALGGPAAAEAVRRHGMEPARSAA